MLRVGKFNRPQLRKKGRDLDLELWLNGLWYDLLSSSPAPDITLKYREQPKSYTNAII